MSNKSFREFVHSLNLPNWAAGGIILVIMVLLLCIVAVAGSSEVAKDKIQMIYQIALIIAGVIGLPLAIWRTVTAHTQAQTGLRQLQGLQKQIALAEVGQEADRLQKGAELLQADGMAVRTAGISILREISTATEHRYKDQALDVLASFFRSRTKEDLDYYRERKDLTADLPLKRRSPDFSDLAEDIRFALSILLKIRRMGNKVKFGEAFMRNMGWADEDFTDGSFRNSILEDCTCKNCNVNTSFGPSFISCRFSMSEITFDQRGVHAFRRCSFSRCTLIGTVSEAYYRELETYECDVSRLQILTLEDTTSAKK